LFKKKSITL